MNEPNQPNTSEQAYYLFYEDKQHGPLSLAQVRGLYLDRIVDDETPACLAGMEEWWTLKLVLPELAQAAAPPHARTQNVPPRNQPVVSTPSFIERTVDQILDFHGDSILVSAWLKQRVSRNARAVCFLLIYYVIIPFAVISWDVRQRDRAARAASTASSHAAQKAKSPLEELKAKAEQGEVSAQIRLGDIYQNGEGVTWDEKEAIKWYRRAAEQNSAEGQHKLGRCYNFQNLDANGELVAGAVAEAMKWFRKSADQNYAPAQNALGECYGLWLGAATDSTEALKWYRKAAEQNHAGAQVNVGQSYYYGRGVTQDYAAAVKWFRKAAEQGNNEAQYKLGFCYYLGEGVAEDEKEAVKWFRMAAERNHANAQFYLGNCYSDGAGVKKDNVEAVKWYRKAAEQHHTEAQFNLGNGYYKGEGVAKDYNEAVKWFRKAAEQDHKSAQFYLGVLYDNGQGVPYADKKEALRWFLKAAERGSLEAQYNAGIMYANGEGTDKDYKESVKWFQKAADGGDAEAQRSLGNAYLRGLGVLQNEAEATKWFFKAASQGQVDSQYRLGLIYKGAGNAAQNQMEAHKWFNLAAAQGNEKARLERDLIAIGMAPQYLAEAKRRAAAFDPSSSSGTGTSATNGFIKPIQGQMAFQATSTERPSVQIVSTTAKVTEQNSAYWKWSYQLTLRNTTAGTVKLNATIQFTDKQGYVMEEETVYDITLRAGEQKTLTGLSLVGTSAAKSVTNVKATTKLK